MLPGASPCRAGAARLVALAEPAVAVTVRMLRAILFPGQSERQVAILLEPGVDGGVVGLGRPARLWRLCGFGLKRRAEASIVPAGNLRPSEGIYILDSPR